MTAIKFNSFFYLGVVALLIVFTLLHAADFISLPEKLYYLILATIILTTAVTTVIITPAIQNPGKEFVLRFLVLTTVQMLAVMSVLVAVWYTNKDNLQSFGVQLIVVFIAQLSLQSLLMIVSNRKSN